MFKFKSKKQKIHKSMFVEIHTFTHIQDLLSYENLNQKYLNESGILRKEDIAFHLLKTCLKSKDF